jgi:hypothetical protein
MGATYRLVCGSCGYEVEVSGGDYAGMIVTTTTVLCERCEASSDAFSSRRPKDPTEGEGYDFEPVELACPRSKRHAVRPWEHPGPCPKCGSLMDVGDMLLLWD